MLELPSPSVRSLALGLFLSLLLGARPGMAAGTAPTPPPAKEPAQTTAASDPQSGQERAKLARAEAEKLYAEGYELVEKAKKELHEGKEKDAKKKFGKARKKFEGAVERDPAYYQAWNMVGYTARNVGDLKQAFAAYEKCLALQPDYDEAHEYLGEAYIMSGDLDRAKVELAWLRARGSDEADELAEKIAEAERKAGHKPKQDAAPAEDAKPAPSPKKDEDSGRVEKADAPKPEDASPQPPSQPASAPADSSATKP